MKRMEALQKEREDKHKPYFTQRQLEGFRDNFNAFGGDDGIIDAKELADVYASLGMNVTMQYVAAVVAEVDEDGSGSIEWREFIQIMKLMDLRKKEHRRERKRQEKLEMEKRRTIFLSYDEDSSGSVSVEELLRITNELTQGTSSYGAVRENDLREMMDELDEVRF